MSPMAEEEIPLNDLLHCLLECSEKAARIAQIFREENDLFELLVEKKSVLERNKRFIQDYKTLADVLVQETIKLDVAQKFPSILSKIEGEEQNTFQNTLGESIRVELTSVPQTTDLLCQVLNGNRHVAEVLSRIVHSESDKFETECTESSCIASKRIGIWIDPIDSTAEYIQAKADEINDSGILQYGLKCVCVLIGAYDLETGDPILGVINQPFYDKDLQSLKWRSKVYWGLAHQNASEISNNLKSEEIERRIIVTSSSENERLLDIMKSRYQVVHAAGAGYKNLLVACKEADLYVLSQGTTHFWDTCGPQAILTAMGGGMLNFQEVTKAGNAKTLDLRKYQIRYTSLEKGIESARNSGGVIAYRNPSDVTEFLQLLEDNNYHFTKDSS
ncbi:inositol polyphosphate 1-phosphatase-like [Uloborus diversus]|uniref:inositol polyphosphate 1-phosphatase-like n=1 Tax=Uloborus diversus TaxID=327109 RepID=UPI00240A89BA|nr:inositol polyphosphate 1-phosphatase-like [Uloborus diversus]